MAGKDYASVIDFWFTEIKPENWWVKDQAFDQMIKDRFYDLLQAAKQCELFSWRATSLGRLAEIILLDQFSRNIYRDTPAAFAQDNLALVLTQEGISVNADQSLDNSQKAFFYMPCMHSESKLMHEIAVQLFSSPGMESNLDFEYKHKKIIDRFGRYPHRNEILGRQSTEDELAFLETANSSF